MPESTPLTDTPIQIGPVTLAGRIFLPAHQPGLAEHGKPGERYIAYHRQRARSGAAMQITGATPIVPSSQWSGICLWNFDDSIIPGFVALGAAVRAEGGRMLSQLVHPGPTEYSGPNVFGASRDLSEPTRQVAVAATAAQIEEVVDLYAAAAQRCRHGELDGVEISMAHGNLLASFLSPLTNRRHDDYGGDAESRLRLPLEVLQAVREVIGTDMMVGVRLGVDDMVENGLQVSEAARIAQAIEPFVDYISVMVGNNNRLEARVQHWPPTPAAPGLFRDRARVIRDAVSTPVAAVGRVLTLELAEDLIAAGDADLVGMVRAQIADGELIAKSRSGRPLDVRPCVGANVCVNNLLADHPLTCMVNPDAGTSAVLRAAQPGSGARVVIVGAGPAGLEAARRLAVGGAQVVLYEKQEVLGGQLYQWSAAPSRREFRSYIAWQQRQLRTLGVELHLGEEATVTAVTAADPHHVVVATGSIPALSQLVRDDLSVPMWTASRVFAEPPPPGTRVTVVDEMGELDAALIAEFVQDRGCLTTLVTSRIHVGEGEGINTLYTMLRNLAERGVQLHERKRLVAAHAGFLEMAGIFGGPASALATDLAVLWSGGEPDLDLHTQLESAGFKPHLIGDALRPRRVTDASADAKAVADLILDHSVVTAGRPTLITSRLSGPSST